jgi:hypothetical protein
MTLRRVQKNGTNRNWTERCMTGYESWIKKCIMLCDQSVTRGIKRLYWEAFCENWSCCIRMDIRATMYERIENPCRMWKYYSVQYRGLIDRKLTHCCCYVVMWLLLPCQYGGIGWIPRYYWACWPHVRAVISCSAYRWRWILLCHSPAPAITEYHILSDVYSLRIQKQNYQNGFQQQFWFC